MSGAIAVTAAVVGVAASLGGAVAFGLTAFSAAAIIGAGLGLVGTLTHNQGLQIAGGVIGAIGAIGGLANSIGAFGGEDFGVPGAGATDFSGANTWADGISGTGININDVSAVNLGDFPYSGANPAQVPGIDVPGGSFGAYNDAVTAMAGSPTAGTGPTAQQVYDAFNNPGAVQPTQVAQSPNIAPEVKPVSAVDTSIQRNSLDNLRIPGTTSADAPLSPEEPHVLYSEPITPAGPSPDASGIPAAANVPAGTFDPNANLSGFASGAGPQGPSGSAFGSGLTPANGPSGLNAASGSASASPYMNYFAGSTGNPLSGVGPDGGGWVNDITTWLGNNKSLALGLGAAGLYFMGGAFDPTKSAQVNALNAQAQQNLAAANLADQQSSVLNLQRTNIQQPLPIASRGGMINTTPRLAPVTGTV